MCASYGLGGGPRNLELTFDLPPMHEPDSRKLIAEWAAGEDHRAKITGRKALNLNPIIRTSHGDLTTELAWWWLHIAGEPARFSAFNSRSDALVNKWNQAFQHRAILPAQWYLEKGYTFALPGDETFGVAAITAPMSSAIDGAWLSYSMVTREAVAGAQLIHARMPLILPRSFHSAWLDPDRAGDSELVREAVAASEEISAAIIAIDMPKSLHAPTLF